MSSSSLGAAVIDALAVVGWRGEPQDTSPDGEVHLLVEAHGAVDPGYPLMMVVHEQRHLVNAYAVMPFDVPVDRRVDVALYLTMANFGLLQGCFELDMTDGEVRFRSSRRTDPADAGRLAEQLAEQLELCVTAFAAYGDGVVRVADGEVTPDEAIHQAESG